VTPSLGRLLTKAKDPNLILTQLLSRQSWYLQLRLVYYSEFSFSQDGCKPRPRNHRKKEKRKWKISL